MRDSLIHVFRNTPFGRETLLQSAYFAKLNKVRLEVYVPKDSQFIIYFQHSVVTVALAKDYLRDNANAEAHAMEVLARAGVEASFLVPKPCAATGLPELPSDVRYFAAPRCIVDHPRKFGLGHLGPKVRAIIKNAAFPVLIPSLTYRSWNRVTAMFGGSDRSINAVRLAEEVANSAGMPLSLFTFSEGKPRDYFIERLKQAGLQHLADQRGAEWSFVNAGSFEESLWAVPADSLIVAAAFGHGPVKDRIFGSLMETMQNEMPNPMLVVGPWARAFGPTRE